MTLEKLAYRNGKFRDEDGRRIEFEYVLRELVGHPFSDEHIMERAPPNANAYFVYGYDSIRDRLDVQYCKILRLAPLHLWEVG